MEINRSVDDGDRSVDDRNGQSFVSENDIIEYFIDMVDKQFKNNNKIRSMIEPLFDYASKILIIEMEPYIDMIKKGYLIVICMFIVLFILVVYLLYQIKLISSSTQKGTI